MNQIETKTILAKLLATEDISIVHDPKMSTAAFDVKARTLYLPVWKEMSNDLYDLFIGHEVGHARNTPEEGWHDAVCDTPNLKAFYNIIEDARIERKIKAQYPGLTKSFHKGYQELFDKDFFGVKGRDLSKLPFVDRVNLHFKIGHLLGLKFTADEQNFLDRVAKTETWEDVKVLSLELADMSKAESEERQDELEPLQQELQDLLDELSEEQQGEPQRSDFGDQSSDEEGEEEESDEAGEGNSSSEDTDEDGNPKPGTPGGEQGEDETDDEYWDRKNEEYKEERAKRQAEYEKQKAKQEAEQKANNEYLEAREEAEKKQAKIEEEIKETKKMHDFLSQGGQKSITDDEFRLNEETLVQLDAQPIVYLTLPKRFKGDELVISMDNLYDWDKSIDLQKVTGTDYWDTQDVPKSEYKAIANGMYQEFIRNSNPIIASMAQQFEMKKAAASSKKNQTSKTGKLNEDKLWAYKLTEDLFHSTTMVPNGKNHGIIMYVDLSGSMQRSMAGTIEQMLNMALFCRKINIPFDVYGFSDRHSDGFYNDSGEWVEDTSGPFSQNKEVEKKILADTPNGEMILTNDGFRLVHLLSSTCKKSEFINAVSYLLLMKVGYNNYSRQWGGKDQSTYFGQIRNRYLSLGGTPLTNCVLSSFSMAERFQKKYNVEVLTTIFLTDGGATDQIVYRDHSRDSEETGKNGSSYVYNDQIAIKDGPVVTKLPSKESFSRYDGVSIHTMLEHYKRITGSTVINFHIVDGKKDAFHRECFSAAWMDGENSPRWVTRDWEQTTWKEILKDKFTLVTPTFGYNARFLIKGNKDLDVGNEELIVKSAKKGDLLRGFRNFNKTKKSSRTFLNKIIELVA